MKKILNFVLSMVIISGSILSGSSTTKAAEVELVNQITSGMGAIYNGTLYYAMNGGGCHTGIIARNLTTGKEQEIISNEGTNGFSNISVYDDYLYCSWDKYRGTDDSDSQIYRFDLKNYKGKYLADGYMPVVAENKLYYWNYSWDENYESEYGLLNTMDLNTCSVVDSITLNHKTFGVDGEYIFQGIYDCLYQNGEIVVAISYEELGEYDEKNGGYMWSENYERGIRIYNLAGEEKSLEAFPVKYLNYQSDGTPYGVDIIYDYSRVMGGGEMIVGIEGENEVLNYVTSDGAVITLKSWIPAE